MNFAPPLSQEEIASKCAILERCSGPQSSDFTPPPERSWNFGGIPEGSEPSDQAELRQSDGSPLGNYTDLHSAPPSTLSDSDSNENNLPDSWTDIPDDSASVDLAVRNASRDANRWHARAHGRNLLWLSGNGRRRPASCGLRLQHGRRSVDLFRCPDRPRGRVGGVCACGQPLLCPVCSPRVSAFRASECEDGFRRAAARGWKANLLVFTSPHTRSSSLLSEVDFWRDAWDEFMASGRSSQILKRQRLGHFGGPELTWTHANGWHFHRNLCVFHDGKLDVEAHKSRWMGCLGKRYSAAAEVHGFHSSPMTDEDMARYCAKQGAEIAWAEGKSSSITPLTLLVRAAKLGIDSPQWVEAVRVVAARKLSIVRWSRGLRGELGMVAGEKTDEQIAIENGTKTDELLGSVTAAQWRCIVSRRLEYRILLEANLGREAVECFLHSHGLGDLLSPEQIAGAYVVTGPKPKRKYATDRSEIDRAICAANA